MLVGWSVRCDFKKCQATCQMDRTWSIKVERIYDQIRRLGFWNFIVWSHWKRTITISRYKFKI